MSETVLVTVISASVSVVVSIIVAALQKRADTMRARQDQEHGYAKALFERRVEYYPELYKYLSGFTKVIRSDMQTIETLATFKSAVDAWNSKYSLFFTRPTSKFSAKFRSCLDAILRRSATGLEPSLEEWDEVRKLIGYFESFLKAEIGIYTTKPVGDPEESTLAHQLVDRLLARAEREADENDIS